MVYMSQNTLTDEQIQQVIAYNEGGGGQTIYPLYYDEKADPPNNLSFSSMTEAEEYECPYVGMTGNISGTDYIFDENYLWVTKYGLFVVPDEYICYQGDKYQKMEEKIRNADDSWSSQDPPVYEMGELVEVSGCHKCEYDLDDPIQFESSEIKAWIESNTGYQNITYRQATTVTRLSIGTAFNNFSNRNFPEFKFFTQIINGSSTYPLYNSQVTKLSLPPGFYSTGFAGLAEMKALDRLVVPSGYTTSAGADFLRFGYDISLSGGTPVITFLGSPPNNYSRFIFDNSSSLYNIRIEVPNDKLSQWKTFIRGNGGSSAEQYVVGINPSDYDYIYNIYEYDC